MHGVLCIFTTESAEVGEEWFSGRSIQEGPDRLPVESTIEVIHVSDTTRVTLKGIPLGLSKRSGQRILLRKTTQEYSLNRV